MPTAIRWPLSLPQTLPKGTRFAPVRNYVESPMDLGPPKRRRRAAFRWGRIIVPDGSFVLREYQWDTFRHFFEQTLADGSLSFMWIDPIPRFGDVELRFGGDDAPEAVFMSVGNGLMVSRHGFELEVMPS